MLNLHHTLEETNTSIVSQKNLESQKNVINLHITNLPAFKVLAGLFTISIKHCTNRSAWRILMMTNLKFISSNKFKNRKFAVLLEEAEIFENV